MKGFWQIIGRWVLPIFSIISAIACYLFIGKSIPRDVQFDYQGIIISIFSLLVTLLVGWQIWQTIVSREDIKDARQAAEKADEIAKKVDLLNNEFKESFNLFDAYRSSSAGLSFLLIDRHFKAFHLFATAIIDSLKFTTDQGRCAMGALINIKHCMDFDENDASMTEYKENWEGVKRRLGEIEDALRKANQDQDNMFFQKMAKHKIDEFKKAAREKGFEI